MYMVLYKQMEGEDKPQGKIKEDKKMTKMMLGKMESVQMMGAYVAGVGRTYVEEITLVAAVDAETLAKAVKESGLAYGKDTLYDVCKDFTYPGRSLTPNESDPNTQIIEYLARKSREIAAQYRHEDRIAARTAEMIAKAAKVCPAEMARNHAAAAEVEARESEDDGDGYGI